MKNPYDLYSVSEASKFLKITVQGVRKGIAKGRISAIRIGKQWCICKEELHRIKLGHLAEARKEGGV